MKPSVSYCLGGSGFIVHKANGRQRYFKESRKSLVYHDMADHHDAMALVMMVVDTTSKYINC